MSDAWYTMLVKTSTRFRRVCEGSSEWQREAGSEVGDEQSVVVVSVWLLCASVAVASAAATHLVVRFRRRGGHRRGRWVQRSRQLVRVAASLLRGEPVRRAGGERERLW